MRSASTASRSGASPGRTTMLGRGRRDPVWFRADGIDAPLRPEFQARTLVDASPVLQFFVTAARRRAARRHKRSDEMTSHPILRIARPTNDIDVLLPFYCDGLGLSVLGAFADH